MHKIGDIVKLPDGTDYHVINRQALRKLPKLLKKQENRSRHVENNFIMLEDQSFIIIELVLLKLKHGKAVYKPGVGLIAVTPGGEELDLFYELRWFFYSWTEIAKEAGEDIDLSPIEVLFKKVASRMPIHEEQIQHAETLLLQLRKLYRKYDKGKLAEIVNRHKAEQLRFEEIRDLVKAA